MVMSFSVMWLERKFYIFTYDQLFRNANLFFPAKPPCRLHRNTLRWRLFSISKLHQGFRFLSCSYTSLFMYLLFFN